MSAIIAYILRSAQKYFLYVNSLIAARKQKRYKSKRKKYALGAHPQVFLSTYAKLQPSRFFAFRVRALTHKSTHIIFISYVTCLLYTSYLLMLHRDLYAFHPVVYSVYVRISDRQHNNE
jgi:hypothetical protein